MVQSLTKILREKKAVMLFFILLNIGQSVHAQIYNKRINTAVPFMRISPDARSAGMGNLSLAMSPESNDLF